VDDYLDEEEDNMHLLTSLDDLLHDGSVVTLGIRPIAGTGGHAVTAWGFRYKLTGDRVNHQDEYYLGVWITDSDDNKEQLTTDPPKNTLRYYELSYNSGIDRWELPTYGGGWWIDLIVALGKRPGDRPVAISTNAAGSEGSTLSFNAAGTIDPDGGLLKYRWDFDGDNAWDTPWDYSTTASYTWNDDFSGNVLLEVFDGTFKDVAEVGVVVSNSAPQVDAYFDKTVEPFEAMEFMGVFIDLGVEDTHTYEWDFGDGVTATGSLSASHSYENSGTYTAIITVTDDDGGVGSDTVTISVVNLPPVFDAGPDLDEIEGYEFTFWTTWDGEKTPSYDITWDFGDGSPVETGIFRAKHTYVEDGVYTATLTVIDGELAPVSDTVTVTVANRNPQVVMNNVATVTEGSPVSFHGSYSDSGVNDVLTAEWDFGDGAVIVTDNRNPTHVYGDDGDYTVTLTVTDGDGGVGSSSRTVIVENTVPMIEFFSAEIVGLDHVLPRVHPVVFNAAFVDRGWLDTHTATIDYGDGVVEQVGVSEENKEPWSMGSLSMTGHAYAEPGKYTVTLTIIDDDGDSSSMQTMALISTASDAVGDMARYANKIEDSMFKSNAKQSRNAFGNMFEALSKQVANEDFVEAAGKMESIRSKADGDGQDWIIDSTAIEYICRNADGLISYFKTQK
jgi:PKD repeat protein